MAMRREKRVEFTVVVVVATGSGRSRRIPLTHRFRWYGTPVNTEIDTRGFRAESDEQKANGEEWKTKKGKTSTRLR